MTLQKRNKKLNEEGQALIEFILGLMIVISFFFFYLRMSAVFAVGNFIHYATFMSARAYMSSSKDVATQTQNAQDYMNAFVKGRFKSVVKASSDGDGGVVVGPGPSYQEDPSFDTWNQGVTYHFTAKLSMYPWSRDGQSIPIDLTSESWMPKEDSASETEAKKSKVAQLIQSSGGPSNVVVEWDNGN